MLGGEGANDVRAAAHQGRRRALREEGGEQFFVTVAQALWAVDHQHAFGFGLLQQVGAVDELHVERRVLAHQDHVQFGQRAVLLFAQLEPARRVGEHIEWAHPRAGLAFGLVQVALFHVEQAPATGLGGQQHGQRAVLLVGDGRDGVHDNAEANAHGGGSSWRRVAATNRKKSGSGWRRERRGSRGAVDGMATRSVLKMSCKP
ncbi:hypothetical protein D3C78_1083020 [compost metagenome]